MRLQNRFVAPLVRFIAPPVVGVIITASLVFSSGMAEAATYYVATTGSDGNPGTLSSPWQTLVRAVAQLHPGDTLYMRGGTYAGSANVIDSSVASVPGGTSWTNAITIAGYPGETVVLDPGNANGGTAIGLLTSTQQYLIFQDFIIDGIHGSIEGGQLVYQSGGSNHIRYQRLEIKNSYGFGIQWSNNNGNSPFNELLNSSIHDNGRNPSPNCGCAQHGIYLFTSDNLIEGNDFYNQPGGYAIHIYEGSGLTHAARNIVRKNKVHGNGTSSLVETGGMILSNGDSNLAYDNLVYNNTGVGISVYAATTNTQIYNNTIYGNTVTGIQLQYYSGPPIIRNNIIFANGQSIVDYGGTGTPIIDHNLTTNPAFINPAAAVPDFHLQASSPAIAMGLRLAQVPDDFDGRLRPAGAADIGAYQYVVSGPPPARPTNFRVAGLW